MSRWQRHLSALAGESMPRWYRWAFAITGSREVARACVDDAVVAALSRPTWALRRARERARAHLLRTLLHASAEPDPDLTDDHLTFLELPTTVRVAMVLHIDGEMTPVRIAHMQARPTHQIVQELSVGAAALGDRAEMWGLQPGTFDAQDGVSFTLITQETI